MSSLNNVVTTLVLNNRLQPVPLPAVTPNNAHFFPSSGLLWELKLSVSKLSMHMVCSKPSLIKLLLHRRNYKNTIFSTLRSLILTQSTPLSVLGDIFDILNSVIDDVLINQVRDSAR